MITQVVLYREMDTILQTCEFKILEELAQGIIRKCLTELAICFGSVERDFIDSKFVPNIVC